MWVILNSFFSFFWGLCKGGIWITKECLLCSMAVFYISLPKSPALFLSNQGKNDHHTCPENIPASSKPTAGRFRLLMVLLSESKGTTQKGRPERLRCWSNGDRTERSRPHSGSGYPSFCDEIPPPETQRWIECGASVSGFSLSNSTSHNNSVKKQFPHLRYVIIYHTHLPGFIKSL